MKQMKKTETSFDYLLFVLILAVSLLGIAMIASAGGLSMAARQGIAMIIGAGAMYCMMRIPEPVYRKCWWVFSLINLTLLGLTLFFGIGREETGGQSWLVMGPIRFQPAELVKIGFIIAYAAHIDRVHDRINHPAVLLGLALHAGVILALILAQPDAGTALVFFLIALVMLFIAGLSWGWICGGLIAAGAAAPFLWSHLRSYQQERILTFFDPDRDPFGAGFQVLQSKAAIAGGGMTGQGYLHGSLTHSDAIPAKATDFIFSVLGEELGTAGCLVIMALLFCIILRCFLAGTKATSPFGAVLCAGVGAMFFIHTAENIGMCIGLTPVTGIPLPFFSYGGTALVTSIMGIGIVMSRSRNSTAPLRKERQ